MSKKVIIADSQYLVREGIKAIVQKMPNVSSLKDADCSHALHQQIKAGKPDVVVIDFNDADFGMEDLTWIKDNCKKSKIIAITKPLDSQTILTAIDKGVDCYLLKECDEEEIRQALSDEKFFCGKVLDIILKEEKKEQQHSCSAVNLSEREVDIIRLISKGHTNSEMAAELYLSVHTINTHRKNILKKTNARNTAGIVMYAVKEKIVSPNDLD